MPQRMFQSVPFRSRRFAASLACAIAVSCAIATSPLVAQDSPPSEETPAGPGADYKFPSFDEMELPPAEHFLGSDPNAPRDWIVLKDAQTIAALPVVPRPNTLDIRRREIEAKLQERKGLTGVALDKYQREYKALQGLEITIPEFEPEPEFSVPIDQIDRIVHHEDQWLQRIDRVIAERNIDLAMELLNALLVWKPDWPGVSDRANNLLFADAGLQLDGGQPEAALMVLEELARRQPGYNGLAAVAVRAVEPQITSALRAEDYRGARYFLGRLQAIAPGTPLYTAFIAEMSQRSAGLLAQAKDAQSKSRFAEAVALVNQAARVWPDTQGLAAAHKAIVERYQLVLVGVTTSGGQPTAYPFETVADARRRSLTEIPLFEPYAFEGGAARYRTRFFDEWVPSDLGRTTRFTLRQTRQPWESQPVLLAWPVADRLRERLDPSHPRYDERLAGYVESLDVESPFEFTMTFRRPPPRLEALLTDPIVSAPPAAASTASEASLSEALPAGAFQIAASDDRATTYRRYYPEPDRLRQYHVAEVVEVLYDNPEAALAALQAGEVSVLPDMPAWIIRRVENEAGFQRDFFVQQHALPQTHVIQFNPDSPVLASRELRRALTYAVDRRGILDEVLLRRPGGTQGRVASGPFPSASRANALGLEPRPYDPYAGLALAYAAKATLQTKMVITDELPTLRLIAPPEPLLREAAAKIVAGWKRIGIEVELVPDDDATAYAEGRWDLVYRRVQMAEPVVDLWPFLTRQPTARIDDLARVPDWLKQEILDLDRASDAIRAEDRARTLHRHLALEAAILPLWELDQYTIYRKTLRGFAVHPLHCYDNIDEWVQDASLQALGR